MSKRDDILSATKQLFWERGYEATSPRDIQAVSGAGQGSFYHHFKSKRELAHAAMSEVTADRIARFERDLSGGESVKTRIKRFLSQPKDASKGCRVGRMVWDSAATDELLRTPLARYFQHVERRLQEELIAEAESGKLQLLLPPEQIALIITGALQGSFTISRATRQSRTEDMVVALGHLLDSVLIDIPG